MDGIINQEDITIINIYAPNVTIHDFVKQILLDIYTQTNPNTIIVSNFSSSHSLIGHPCQKSNKETLQLNNTVDQMDLTDFTTQQQHNTNSSQQPM
jgi:hypothetical protein